MNSETRQTVYMGISFIFSPMPLVNKQTFVAFQNALLSVGVDFNQSSFPGEREIMITRDGTSTLQIRVIPNPPASGQLIVVTPQPGMEFEIFVKETQAIIAALDLIWPPPRQMLHSDATLRDLFDATGTSAFQELWEKRLKQSEQALHVLGRPVLGGGLRLVMPPVLNEEIPTQIEVKIESYLSDSKKFFIETQFTWPQPVAPGLAMDPEAKLKQLDNYVEKNVIAFAMGDM